MDDEPIVDMVLKALDGSTNTGGEMLPTETKDEIIQLIYDKSWVRQIFPDSVDMTASTVEIPKLTSSITFYGVSDSASSEPTSTTHGTDSVTLSMKTIMARVPIKKKLLAYAIPSLASVIKRDISNAIADAEGDMVMNGDTDTTSSNINGTLSTGDIRLEVDGLRVNSLDSASAGEITNVNASGSAITTSLVRSAIKAMGTPAKMPSELVLMVSNSSRAEMLGWDELETIDKYGPNATMVVGEIGKVYGIPVVATDNISETVGTDGTGTGTTTIALLLRKDSPMVGFPASSIGDRAFRIETEYKPGLDQINMFPAEDIAFAVRERSHIITIYNLAP